MWPVQPVPYVSAQYRHAVNDAEAAEIWDFIERQETKTMKRAAKHIVIQFTVGYKRDEFRMRVGGDIERPAVDELGAAMWIKVPGDEPSGLPTKRALLEATLNKVLNDGKSVEGSDQIWVNLGNITA